MAVELLEKGSVSGEVGKVLPEIMSRRSGAVLDCGVLQPACSLSELQEATKQCKRLLGGRSRC